MYYIIRIALFTGIRLSEILNLKPENILLEMGILNIDGKTGKRNAYIVDELKENFEFLIGNCSSDGYIFETGNKTAYSNEYIGRLFRKIIAALGLNESITDDSNKVVFHTLRHTFCSWLARAGVPLYTIAQLAGHNTQETTKRYAKLDLETKQKALEHLHQIFISTTEG